MLLCSLITSPSSSISTFSWRVSKGKIAQQYEETDGSTDEKIHLTFTILRDGELD